MGKGRRSRVKLDAGLRFKERKNPREIQQEKLSPWEGTDTGGALTEQNGTPQRATHVHLHTSSEGETQIRATATQHTKRWVGQDELHRCNTRVFSGDQMQSFSNCFGSFSLLLWWWSETKLLCSLARLRMRFTHYMLFSAKYAEECSQTCIWLPLSLIVSTHALFAQLKDKTGSCIRYLKNLSN